MQTNPLKIQLWQSSDRATVYVRLELNQPDGNAWTGAGKTLPEAFQALAASLSSSPYQDKLQAFLDTLPDEPPF